MRIAIVTDWFSSGMGYAENIFPRTLARMGHEVSVLASDLQVYGNTKGYASTYREFLGPNRLPLGIKHLDGFTLHRLARSSDSGFTLFGLEEELRKKRNDIIYAFEINVPTTKQLLMFDRDDKTSLFVESRLHESVFSRATGGRRVRQLMRNRRLGRLVQHRSTRVLPIADDVASILKHEFGIAGRHMSVLGLGVDDSVFYADKNDVGIRALRRRAGASESDFLVVYTGRLSREKGVDLLLEAFGELPRLHRYSTRLLLVGDGELASDAMNVPGVVVMKFQPQSSLATIYRSADLGVWPRQETTSRYDASACGLPLVVASSAGDRHRLPVGTKIFDPEMPGDLARVLLSCVRGGRRSSNEPDGFRLPTELRWSRIAERILDFHDRRVR